MNAQALVSEIKASKKYSGISSEVIEKEVDNFIKKNPLYENFKEKFILKQIKENLHKMHGSFKPVKKGKVAKLLDNYRKTKDNEVLKRILETHLSTKERLAENGFIYEKIFEITGKVDSIMDLACGLNPLSYRYMHLDKEVRYYAYDINEDELKIIKEFFEIERINGHAEVANLKDLKVVKKLPSADLIFLFKALDPLERDQKGHLHSEEIVNALASKCKFIVISFATTTISGKKMNFSKRGWIERMLPRLGLKFKTFSARNELFYVVSRN